MIQRDSSMRVMMCDLCGEQTAVSRGMACNPEAMAIAAEEMADDHRDCEHYKDEPEKARLIRQFRQRCRRDLKTEQKPIEPHALRFGPPVMRW